MQVLLFLAILGCSVAQQMSCPFAEDIKPCVCVARAAITCEALSSADSLRKAATGMKKHSVSTFSLINSNIGTLPADIFSDMEIHILTMKYTNLTFLSENIHRPAFLGLENSLEYLEIQDCFTNEESPLTRLFLSHLHKLSFLKLEGNLMPTIANDWFESGPYHLKELHLLDTRANQVGSHAFTYLGNLRQLSLTGSHLAQLSRQVLPQPALALEALDFSNNRLKTLPKSLFSQMPSLRQVHLANNDLVTMSELVFAPVWSQLKHVNIYGNPLNCDESMKWIYKYRLPASFQGYCVLPERLRYRVLTNITLSDFEG